MALRAAIVTISDSASAGFRADASGPAIVEILRKSGWEVVWSQILPDDKREIRAALERLTHDSDMDAVFTTGGTGVSPRDVNPEATREVVEREIPGLAELMRMDGLRYTRRAVLSRAVVGIRNRVVIVNLPGSPKGAVQSLEAILDLLPHTVELARGTRVQHD